MAQSFLSPEESLRFIELASKPFRPPQIVELMEEIESKTRIAELRFSVAGLIDELELLEIVEMKFELDRLYGLWAQGKL